MNVLTAFYDLAVGPVSFDFLVFGVKAELARRAAKCDHLHVVIVPHRHGIGGMFRDKTALYDEAEMRWRLWNICIPACHLIGASVTLAVDWEQAWRLKTEQVWPPDWDRQTLTHRRHLIGDVITAARAGAAIPRVRASAHALRKAREACARLRKPIVTLTLRSTYLEERNAVRAEWQKALRHIEGRGYAVVWLEDTNTALANGNGYGELNLDLRAACYELAELNLQANNGAASLCWFSERPYRMFGCAVPAAEWDGLFVKQGLPLGATWPWARPEQKLCYGPYGAAQIIEEFESFRAGAPAWGGVTKSS